MRLHGKNFIADSTSANRGSGRRVEAVLTAKFDRAANEELCTHWFVFLDHRPELPILLPVA